MNVTSTLGGLNTATTLAAAYPSVSTQAQRSAGQAMDGSNNTAFANGSANESLTAQESNSAFTRYTSQYRRLTTIVLDNGGKYDRDQQLRAYMELRSMAASGKLKGMQAEDQRLWMQVNNSTVSLLQSQEANGSGASDSSSITPTTSTSQSQSTDSSDSSSVSDTSGNRQVATVSNSRDNDNDTVDLSPSAQEIVNELQAQQQSSDSQGTLEAVQDALYQDDSYSSELGTVVSLTV